MLIWPKALLHGVLLTVQVSNKGDDLPTLCDWDVHVIKHWGGGPYTSLPSFTFTYSTSHSLAQLASFPSVLPST